jgi:hypothetical protein
VLPEIAHIEPDRVMTMFGDQPNPGSWGIRVRFFLDKFILKSCD